MVLRGSLALRFLRRRGLQLCRLVFRLSAVLRRLRLLLPVLALLLRVLGLLLAPSTPAARAAARLFGRRQVLGQPVCDFRQPAELLARGVDQLIGPRCVALGRGEQCRADLERLLARRVDELRSVLLVPVSARVCQRPKQALCLGKLGARAAILHLSGRAGQAPGPASEDLLGSVGLSLTDRA